jgi:hypothetical protein
VTRSGEPNVAPRVARPRAETAACGARHQAARCSTARSGPRVGPVTRISIEVLAEHFVGPEMSVRVTKLRRRDAGALEFIYDECFEPAAAQLAVRLAPRLKHLPPPCGVVIWMTFGVRAKEPRHDREARALTIGVQLAEEQHHPAQRFVGRLARIHVRDAGRLKPRAVPEAVQGEHGAVGELARGRHVAAQLRSVAAYRCAQRREVRARWQPEGGMELLEVPRERLPFGVPAAGAARLLPR